MTIQVNSKLTLSRNPAEHNYKLENAKGEVVHRLNDGYNLIKFVQFQIKHQVKVNSVKKWENVALEWYVHNDDLKIYFKE